MKKALAIVLVLVLCFGSTACVGTPPAETISTEAEITSQMPTPPPTEETKLITYTYKAEPMQNAECDYYVYNGKVTGWSQCPNCGEENIPPYTIDPAEQDFSFGDTIMHSDTDSCYDCSRDKGIDQFMWVICVTRIPE